MVRDKKVLEKRVEHLEKTSSNWMNMNRAREDVIKRSTLTNFAKRTIIEQNINQSKGDQRFKETNLSTHTTVGPRKSDMNGN